MNTNTQGMTVDINANDTRIIVTSGGTYCLFDNGGRLVGTIEHPVERQPLGPGRDTVYLARPHDAKAPVAA